MIFSGDQILACPHCNQFYKNRIVTSYNTFISRYFSDGYLIGEMIPNFISIVKCVNKNCSKFFNIDEAKQIGILDDESVDIITEEWKTAIALYEYKIGANELEEALETDFVKEKDNEVKIRTILFQRYNDVLREDRNNKSHSRDNHALCNIERLIQILQKASTTSDKLLLGELFREKGDFDSCLKTLKGINGETEGEKVLKEKIYSQAKVKDDIVFKVGTIATKKEYRCDNCGHNIILFDFKKINNILGYKHYRCKNDNEIFDSSSKSNNPSSYYKLTLWQKLFKSKVPYQSTVQNKIVCPKCNGIDVELFDPETQKCVNCGQVSYASVKWFINN